MTELLEATEGLSNETTNYQVQAVLGAVAVAMIHLGHYDCDEIRELIRELESTEYNVGQCRLMYETFHGEKKIEK